MIFKEFLVIIEGIIFGGGVTVCVCVCGVVMVAVVVGLSGCATLPPLLALVTISLLSLSLISLFR